MLSEVFDVTLLYNNSNIYPKSEYTIRFDELKAYTEHVNEKYNCNIKIVEVNYDTISYHKKLAQVNDDKEGGLRCQTCYEIRMDEAYGYALENDFDYFTTVMSISVHKNSIILNEIGEHLNQKYQSNLYLFSDFKKKDGLLKSKQFSDDFKMYRQQYCGCAYSYSAYLKRGNNEKSNVQKTNITN